MKYAKFKVLVILVQLSAIFGLSLPPEHVLVVRSVDATSTSKEIVDAATENVPPKITELSVNSNITNRFATTQVKSKVKNPASVAQEVTFFIVLPDQAYISGFIMEIGGKNYTAYVANKQDAKRTYDEAIRSGIGAAHVAVSARDSNKFTVSTNVEAESKATFYLTYEELLDRKDGYYEQIINIHPKQLVKNLNVEVNIDESRPLVFVKAPPIRSGNEIAKESEKLDSKANIERPSPNSAVVKFNPDDKQQKEIAQGLGTKEDEGMSGQFVVQYEVERDPSGGEVLVKDGYFVHFFAPSDLQPLTKHIVFVLDTSGSMYDRKIEQLKLAMKNILGELNAKDLFNLVEFNTDVKVWNLDAPSESTKFPNEGSWYVQDTFYELGNVSFPPAYPVNNNTIKKVNSAVSEMFPTGGTNIYEALRVGIHLIKLREQRTGNKNIQSLILFLTDGDPTVGKTDTKTITSGISEENLAKIPIVSLSFGEGADRNFLKKLSLSNFGFARHIYEDSDASLQLENFYKEISSPLLHNVKFTYTNDTTSLTKTNFPILYGGSELVVAGKIPTDTFEENPMVGCFGINGPITLRPQVKKSVGQLERLWAYLTVKKYLAAKEIADKTEEYDRKVLDLSLKYSFVTPVTSLVVVKPNETKAVDAEAADRKEADNVYPSYAASGAGGFAGQASPLGFQTVQLSAANYAPFQVNGALPAPSYMPAAPPLQIPKLGSAYGGGGGGGVSGLSNRAMYITTPFTPTALRPMGAFDSDAVVDSYDRVEAEEEVAQTIPTVEPVTIPPAYQTKLPWLAENINPDGSLKFYTGKYQLGFNETSPDNLECTDPKSEEGQCKLIKDCEELHPIITSPQIFKDYFCIIEGSLAGVCCPKKKSN